MKISTDKQSKINRKYNDIEYHNNKMNFFIKEGDIVGENQQLDCIILLQNQINKLEIVK